MDIVEKKGEGAGAESCTVHYSLCGGCTSTWKNLLVHGDGGLLNFTASGTLSIYYFLCLLVLLPSTLQMFMPSPQLYCTYSPLVPLFLKM